MRGRVLAAILVMLSFGITTTASSAERGPDSAAADALFEEGRAAVSRGDFALACEKFELSRRLEPAVGAWLNLGECYLKLERPRAAWIAFREALRLMSETDDRHAYARERLAALDTELARLVLRWEAPSSSGDRVMVNGEPIAAPFDVPRIVEPGPVTVRVDRESSFLELTGVAQKGTTLTMTIPAPAGPAEKDSRPSRAPRAESASSGRRVLGFTLTGIGAASIATGTAFGIAALISNSDAQNQCAGFDCPSAAAYEAARRSASSASNHATVSTSLLVGGAVITLAGIYFVVTSPPRSLQAFYTPLGFKF